MPRAVAKRSDGALSATEITEFRHCLLAWFARQKRDLPWRRTRDPYAILVSEIMLQQTRVAAVIPFYERFLQRFPTLQELAQASETELLSHWAGLGYYHRARNLQKAAQIVATRPSFPESAEEIGKLPGVGAYTRAAVASIAFEKPEAAVDGNVLRVLSRVYAEASDIGSVRGRAKLSGLAEVLLDRSEPGSFNQAMMELGATVCTPKKPQCLVCPVMSICRARQAGLQDQLPIKLARTAKVEEERTVYWIEQEGKLLLWQRPPDSRLMPGFWELPQRSQLSVSEAGRTLGTFRHTITFHLYRFTVVEAACPAILGVCEWIAIESLPSIPVSTIVRKAARLRRAHPKKKGTETALAASAD